MERWHSSVMMKSNSSMGKAGLYSTGTGCLNSVSAASMGRSSRSGAGSCLALEHGVKALDGADDDAGGFVEGVAREMLDDVFLGELVVVHGRDELLELLEGLPAEVAAVHEEQDAARAGVLDEAVSEVDGGEGLARAGGHLDEGAPQAGGEGLSPGW